MMAVRRDFRRPLALALPVLAGMLAPMTAAQAKGDGSLSSPQPSLEFKTPHAPSNRGFRGIVLFMHRIFGEMLLPTEDPAHLIRELQSAVRYLQAPKTLEKKVALAKGTDIAFSLLQDTDRVLGLVALCSSMAVLIPVVALGILCGRFLCGICGGGVPSGENLNVGDGATGRRCSIVFCVLTGLMTFTLLGAFFTREHMSVAVQGAIGQANFLVSTLPLVIRKDLQDLDDRVGANFQELQDAVITRAKVCEHEAATVVDDLLRNNGMLRFLRTTAERLQTIERKLADIQKAISDSKIASVRLKIVPASAALQSAALFCSPPCDAQLKQELTEMALKLDTDNLIPPLQNAMDFNDALQSLNLGDHIIDCNTTAFSAEMQEFTVTAAEEQIPSPDLLTNTISGLADAFRKALGDYRRNIGKVLVETRLKVKQQGQELLDVLVKFEQNATGSVNRTVTLYQFILGVLLAAMAAIVLQYIAAIYSGLRRVKRGFCGLYMASWMLSMAVVLFQLLFPIALLVSTASLAVGTVFDRFLCFPAQHPGSPASLVIIDFLLTKTMEQARAVGRRHVTVNAGALLTAPTLAQNASSAQPVNSSWKQNISIDKCWDNTEEDTNKKTRTGSEATSPMSQQRMEQYVSSVTSPDEGERWRLYQEVGKGATATNPHTGLSEQNLNLTTRSGGHLDHTISAASTLTGTVKHGTDVPMLSKGFTKFAPKKLLQIGKRFAKCSVDHLSFWNLLGDGLTLSIARRLLKARRNQLLGLIENRPLPTLEGLEQLSGGGRLRQLHTELKNKLSISPDVKNSLRKVADSAGITPAIFSQLAEAANQTRTRLSEIDSIKNKLRSAQRSAPNGSVKNEINAAAAELDKITPDDRIASIEGMDLIVNASMDLSAAWMVDGKDLAVYMSENLNKWESMSANIEKSVASLDARMKSIMTGFNNDLQKYFIHTKTQVRDHFGDCHSLYVMYMTTVDTACNGGVRLFSGFWLSVWLYLVLGIPAWMVALATSTLYTKISTVMESDVC